MIRKGIVFILYNMWYCRKQTGAWLKAEKCLFSAFPCCIYYIFVSINAAHNVADQVQPFILTVCRFFSKGFSSKIMCHCLKMVPGNYFTLLQWSAQLPDHRLIKHFWDEVEVGCSQHSRRWKTAKTTLSSQYRSKSLWNISGTLLNQCLKKILVVLRVEERPAQ